MSDFQTIGLIGRRGDPAVAPTLGALCALLEEFGRKVCIETGAAGLDNLPPTAQRLSRSEIAGSCELVIAVGGDGTLLSVARTFAPHRIPIIGINQGRLGFMVDVAPADMREALESLFEGKYLREERLMLEAVAGGAGGAPTRLLAVNDVVIRNQAAIRMLEFETWLDSEFISQHRADGFIVSTPTGSTAYALSGGGPVLHPSLDAFALVPICPHTLSDRPIVVSGRQTVRIVLRGAEPTAVRCTADGQNSVDLEPGDTLEIRSAPTPMQLIHPTSYSYFNILRNKLHWGRGPQYNADPT